MGSSIFGVIGKCLSVQLVCDSAVVRPNHITVNFDLPKGTAVIVAHNSDHRFFHGKFE